MRDRAIFSIYAFVPPLSIISTWGKNTGRSHSSVCNIHNFDMAVIKILDTMIQRSK